MLLIEKNVSMIYDTTLSTTNRKKSANVVTYPTLYPQLNPSRKARWAKTIKGSFDCIKSDTFT